MAVITAEPQFGVLKNMWVKNPHGLYTKRNQIFPKDFIFYAPFWHPDRTGSSFTSIPSDLQAGVTCTVTNTTWGAVTGNSAGRAFAANAQISQTIPAMPTGAIDLTIAFWIRSSSYATDPAVVFDYGTQANYQLLRVGVGGGSPIIATWNQNTTGGSGLNANAWYMITFTISAGATVKQYQNLTLDKTDNLAFTMNTTSAGKATMIGATQASTQNLSATLAELIVWGRVLAIQDITQLYNGTRWRYGV